MRYKAFEKRYPEKAYIGLQVFTKWSDHSKFRSTLARWLKAEIRVRNKMLR